MENLISKIRNSLIKKDLALFCGAGISFDSGLPLANEFKNKILEKLLIDKKDIDEITKSTLPFEAFMEAIASNANISSILDIFEDGIPNTNHIFIAKLAKQGFLKTILTTNFDLHIENAFENEGLKNNEDFEVFYNEEQFSEIDFKKLENKKIRLFKIHGSVEDKESIRITLQAVASKMLSDKRIDSIKYLFSTGSHKNVMVLGYSCSDEFDIVPQIKNLKENQKEIIIVDHSNVKSIEDIKTKNYKNPFKRFTGTRIVHDTNDFIRDLWNSLKGEIGEYSFLKSKGNWQVYIDNWCKVLEENKGYLKCFIPSSIFYAISNINKAIDYDKRSLEIAKSIKNKTQEAICYTNLGAAYYNLGDFNKAMDNYKESLEIAKVIKDKAQESKNYTGFGNVHNALGNFRMSIDSHEKSLVIYKAIGDKVGESWSYTNLGIAYGKLGDFDMAIDYHENALGIAKTIGDKIEESICYTNLGNVYGNLGDFKMAIKYFEKSLEIDKEIGNKRVERICYNGLGNAYCSLGDFEMAKEFYDRSLEIAKEIGDKAGESSCYTNLGVILMRLGNFSRAIEYCEKSMEIAKSIRDKEEEAKCYVNLGSIYSRLGDFNNAIPCFLKAEKIFEDMRQMHHLKFVYNCLSLSYRNIGDYEKAEKYRRIQ